MKTAWVALLVALFATVQTVTLTAAEAAATSKLTPQQDAEQKVRINPDDGSNTLPAGHSLVTKHNYDVAELDSNNGRFNLYLTRFGSLQLDNEVKTPRGAGADYPVWGRQIGRAPKVRVTVLQMKENGNLVLRCDGKRIWSTGTVGSGDRNYAKILNGGALVVRTAAGHTVWSSRTTAVEMTVGDRLAAGRTLINRIGAHGATRLTMRRGGDLTLRHGSETTWTSGTHVRGSSMLVTKYGRIDVQAPSGRIVWRSAAVGRQPVLTVATNGRLTLGNEYHSNRCWQRPRHTGGCGAG